MRIRRVLALLALLAAPAGSGSAQSLFTTAGLGLPNQPLDARALLLGGGGVGLFGANPSLVNPAEAAGFTSRGVSATFQPTSRSLDLEGGEGQLGGTRFPLLTVLYPLTGRIVLQAGAGSFLDQSFGVEVTDSIQVGGAPVEVRDALESSGGISQLRAGFSLTLTPDLVVGVAGGAYTGSLTRSVRRTFVDSAGLLRPFEEEARWSYGAPLLTVGARWDPVERIRLGGAVTVAGRLDADGEDGTPDRSFDMPLQVDVGASAILSANLLLAGSMRYADWSAAGEGFDPAEDPTQASPAAGDEWRVGGGLEWGGLTSGARSFPLRLGFRIGKLPFRPVVRSEDALPAEADRPTEWSVGAGLSFRLTGQDAGPGALVDAGIERGRISAEGATPLPDIVESYWRFTLSLGVFGR
ncbi:MAG TPA: hypothetical protein VML95_04235 [Longimicrobiales bacterium]|nr:hypothetical protein [Longimicrobiales bacterium]